MKFSSNVITFLSIAVTTTTTTTSVVHASDLDCSQLETDVIQDVIALGQDSKNKLFDTIERLQSRLHGEKQCTDSEWRINYGHLSYYKIGDGTPDGVGCHDVPLMGLDVTGMEWPYDTNDKGVNHQEYPAATVRKGMCGSGIPGMVLQCTPEPIQNKYSYDRPTNKYVVYFIFQFLFTYRSFNLLSPLSHPVLRPSVPQVSPSLLRHRCRSVGGG